jgi:hypothetical protein
MDSLNQPLSTVTPMQEEYFPSFPVNGCPGALVRVNLIPVLYTQMEPMLVVLLQRLMYLKRRHDPRYRRPTLALKIQFGR